MALTLPTEVTNNKDKQGTKPVLLVEIPGLSVYFSSKDYTMDEPSRTYAGDSAKNFSSDISQKLTDDVNKISSLSNITLRINDYRGTYRSSIFEADSTLNDQAIDVYLKYDTGDISSSGRLKIFSGFIDGFSILKDQITLRAAVKRFSENERIPAELLSDHYSIFDGENGIALPRQYGDFAWSTDPRWWGDVNNGYAICPYVNNEGGQKLFHASSHEMNEFPNTLAQVNTKQDSYIFSYRGKHWVHHQLPGITTTNNSGGCYFKLNSGSGFTESAVWMNPNAVYTGGANSNTATNLTNAIDGKSATVASFGDITATHGSFDGFNFSDDFRFDDSSLDASIFIYLQNPSTIGNIGTVRLRRKSDDSILFGNSFNGDVTGWRATAVLTGIDTDDFADSYIEIECKANEDFEVGGVLIFTPVENWDVSLDEKCLYVRCKGREFSGTWESRKTSGNLIENPYDMLESVFRDELSYTNINTTSFDNATTVFSTYKAGYSFINRMSPDKFLNEFAKSFNVGVGISPTGDATLAIPNDSLDFTGSGTSTPGKSDIITDQKTASNGSFSKNPILKGSFIPGKTKATNLVEKLRINYTSTMSGEFKETGTTGSGNEAVLENIFTGNSTTITALLTFIHGFLSVQRWYVELTTFNNAIDVELGDIKNVQHDDLTDALLPATVTTQKWIVTSLRMNPLKELIKIRLIAIP